METIINHLTQAFLYIIDVVDWEYLITFMLTCYVILKGFENTLRLWREKTLEKWFTRTRTIVLVVGVIYAIAFGIIKHYYGLPWHGSTDPSIVVMPYGFVIFFSFILGQFLNLYGIDKLVDTCINGIKVLVKCGVEKFKKM